MYFHNVVGTGSYTTSTTNMYNKYQFHVPPPSPPPPPSSPPVQWVAGAEVASSPSPLACKTLRRPEIPIPPSTVPRRPGGKRHSTPSG